MLQLILITSLKILFIYEAMKEGNILFPLRRLLEWLLNQLPLSIEQYAKKPLYDCLFCMVSVWGMIFTTGQFACTWQYAMLLFAIAGMNYLIGTCIGFVHWLMEEEV